MNGNTKKTKRRKKGTIIKKPSQETPRTLIRRYSLLFLEMVTDPATLVIVNHSLKNEY